MSESTSPGETAVDRETSGGRAEDPATCTLCSEPIRGSYYRAADGSVCPTCRDRALAARDRGTSAGRFARAAALGGGAAVLGAVVWYAVAVWTDREFGLLAIAIGLLVGGAVRLGSYRRGGWRYQALAMVLTYTAIVSSYVPFLFEAANEAVLAAPGDELAAGGDETEELLAASELDPSPDSTKGAQAVERSAVQSTEAVGFAPADGPGEMLKAVAILIGIVFAAPFLAGFENFMGWVFLAIALYEAWKLNRREELVFEGPLHPPGRRTAYVPEPVPPPIAP